MKKINIQKIILVLIPVLFIFSGVSKADTYALGWTDHQADGAGGNSYYERTKGVYYYMTLQNDKTSYSPGDSLTQLTSLSNIQCYFSETYSPGPDGITPLTNTTTDCNDPLFQYNDILGYDSKNPALLSTTYGKPESASSHEIQLSGTDVANQKDPWTDILTIPTNTPSGNYYSNRLITNFNYSGKIYSPSFSISSTSTPPAIFVK